MAEISTRERRRRELLDRLPKGAVCAEIGVWEGGFSQVILDVTQPKELHLIDPWEVQPDYANTAFGKDKNTAKMARLFQTVTDLFDGDDRVTIHRQMSDAALASFPDGYFDWVYLDGNHNYDVITNDLRLALAKVKPNGMIAGDDLLWQVDAGAPVRRAVREVKRRLGAHATYHRMGQQWLFDLARA